jgi:hypothetical protein
MHLVPKEHQKLQTESEFKFKTSFLATILDEKDLKSTYYSIFENDNTLEHLPNSWENIELEPSFVCAKISKFEASGIISMLGYLSNENEIEVWMELNNIMCYNNRESASNLERLLILTVICGKIKNHKNTELMVLKTFNNYLT